MLSIFLSESRIVHFSFRVWCNRSGSNSVAVRFFRVGVCAVGLECVEVYVDSKKRVLHRGSVSVVIV